MREAIKTTPHQPPILGNFIIIINNKKKEDGNY